MLIYLDMHTNYGDRLLSAIEGDVQASYWDDYLLRLNMPRVAKLLRLDLNAVYVLGIAMDAFLHRSIENLDRGLHRANPIPQTDCATENMMYSLSDPLRGMENIQAAVSIGSNFQRFALSCPYGVNTLIMRLTKADGSINDSSHAGEVFDISRIGKRGSVHRKYSLIHVPEAEGNSKVWTTECPGEKSYTLLDYHQDDEIYLQTPPIDGIPFENKLKRLLVSRAVMIPIT